MRILTFVALLLAFAMASFAQTTYDTSVSGQTGTQLLGSYFATDIDSVSLTNGNLHLRIPLFSLPGRELSTGLALDYNSRFVETRKVLNEYGGWTPQWEYQAWRTDAGNIGSQLTADIIPLGGQLYQLDVYWVQSNGSKQKFSTQFTSSNPPTESSKNNRVITSTDSSFVTLKTLSYFTASMGEAELFFKDGTKLTIKKNTGGNPAVPQWTMATPNGNLVVTTGSSYQQTDTLGRSFNLTTNGNTTSVALQDSNGQSQTYSWQTQALNGLEPWENFTGAPSSWSIAAAITTVTLPNGKTYQLEYNTAGMVSKVTFPTGAYIRYTYVREFQDGTSGKWRVATRNVSADGTAGSEKTWTYTLTYTEWNGPYLDGQFTTRFGNIVSTTVVDPTGGKEIHYFSGGLETKVEHQNAAGATVEVMERVWANNSANPRVSSVTKRRDSGLPYTTTYEYEEGYNNPTKETWYDFNGNKLGYITRTYWIYLYIRNRVWSEWLYNSDNVVVAATDYFYDEFPLTTRSGVPGHNGNTAQAGRGNVTTIRKWKDAYNYLLDKLKYDILGNAVEKIDAGNHSTLIAYTDKFSDAVNRNTFAFPTRITAPSGAYTDTTYDYRTSLVKQTTDFLGRTSQMTYDSLNRPTLNTQPNGGWTSHAYDDNALTTTKEIKVDAAGNVGRVKTYVDKMYREIKKETSDPEGNIFVETQYDAKGRKWKVSNPYRSGDTVQWTEFQYDTRGRPTVTTAPDGSTVQYAYNSNQTVTTDEAGNQRRYTYDALGRMIMVEEPNPTLNTPLVTSYTYNLLGKVTQSTQGTQTRTWVFDWLGRMTSETLPESGTTTFAYTNADGMLSSKTDARGVTTTMTYGTSGSALHQVTGKSYSNSTPAVSLGFNSLGLRTSMNDGLGSVAYTYDSTTDRLTQESRTLTGISGTFSTSYAYNIKGDLTSMTYPSGRVVNLNYATGGGCCNSRLASVVDQTTSTTITNNLAYNAAGETTNQTYGNGVVQTFGYNNRLEQTTIAASLSGTTLMSFTYNYGTATTNTGRVLSRTDGVQPEHSVQYAYDSIYRLTQAFSPDSSWGIAWTFDIWGNRLTQTPQGLATGKVGTQTLGYTNNRLTTNTYDTAGNQTNDGSHSYTFNGENQITQMDGGAAVYGYDGEGRRMKKTVGSETTYMFYGAGGLLCEFTTNTGATQAGSTNRTTYRTSDKLGTAVLTLNASGTVIENNRTLPYGEAWLTETASTNDKKFTTYQRDTESNLDYAGARYYQNTLARFTSVDPGAAVSFLPRTLNRYAYTSNDPINKTDSDGRQEETIIVELPPIPPAQQGDAVPWWYVSTLIQSGRRRGMFDATDETWDRWTSLSMDCERGLTEAMTDPGGRASELTMARLRLDALDRANAARQTLIEAASGSGVDWTFLAAIGIRETGFRNINQPDGQGVGIFQIDLGQHPNVTFDQASDAGWASQFAAILLANYGAELQRSTGLTGYELQRATVSAYNHGTATVIANVRDRRSPDVSRATGRDNNYGGNIMTLAECFR